MAEEKVPPQSPFDEYAELARAKAGIEERMDELKPIILANMAEQKVGSVKLATGTFSVRKTSKWEYSSEVVAMEDMVAMRKEDERERGVAKVVESESLLFKAK